MCGKGVMFNNLHNLYGDGKTCECQGGIETQLGVSYRFDVLHLLRLNDLMHSRAVKKPIV